MTPKEIREIATNSAEVYYKYLKDNEKGLQTIEVFDLKLFEIENDLQLVFRLSAKIVDKDSICIYLRTNGKQYPVNQISIEDADVEEAEEENNVEEGNVQIVSYDEERHILKIKVSGVIVKEFTGLKSKDILVISDLTFLVERVRKWYERNGAKIELPTNVSILKDKIAEIKYLEGLEPSENQKQSLRNIFTNPFTYIWGAPGTGKTQFVLAYAVLHYIRNGHSVGILAPTNNALEQVLRGVIKMTDKAGISRYAIARMGTPSKSFANEFPEVCSREKNEESLDKEEDIKRQTKLQLFACTLDFYAGKYRESKMNVQHLFLDEAGYANMIKAGMLFNHKIPITLLGDHAQLPPVCELNDFDIEKVTEFENMFLWSQSSIYFETLFDLSKEEARHQYLKNITPVLKYVSKTSLNTTYRFGENLAKVLGLHVYSLDFSSGNKDNVTKISFIHAPKQDAYKSRESVTEAVAIKQLAAIFRMKGITDYAILTPYKKQVKLLGQHLPNERNEFKIMTVHGSQGREWDTVIVSVADTSDKWFVDSLNIASRGLNLVNTAVSRTRKELIVVCDTNYWKHQFGQLIYDLIRIGEEIRIERLF
jgi:hypothetical protein